MLGINQNITQKSETTRNIQRKAGEKGIEKRGMGELKRSERETVS